jgi:hypothetical protein
VGEIEHVGARFFPATPPPGAIARPAPTDVSFTGKAVDYVSVPFTFEKSWAMLPPTMREWAGDRAGAQIRDPHTGVPTVYWYCRVRPGRTGGPPGAPVPATYDLMMFGKRGLAVSSGTTDAFQGELGTTAWRHRRFDVPVDPAAIRHDHREAPAETATPSTDGQGGGPGGHARGGSPPLLPTRIGATFGNLPAPTQRFLLEPFTVRGKRPVEADVHPTTHEVGRTYRETYWCYLFDASWMAFAHARRSVPLTSGRAGPALWNGSPEADALQRMPWTVAAWVAPVRKNHRAVVKS